MSAEDLREFKTVMRDSFASSHGRRQSFSIRHLYSTLHSFFLRRRPTSSALATTPSRPCRCPCWCKKAKRRPIATITPLEPTQQQEEDVQLELPEALLLEPIVPAPLPQPEDEVIVISDDDELDSNLSSPIDRSPASSPNLSITPPPSPTSDFYNITRNPKPPTPPRSQRVGSGSPRPSTSSGILGHEMRPAVEEISSSDED